MNKIKIFPFVLINMGILIIIDNISVSHVWGIFWPTILITIGVLSIINSIILNRCE